MTDKETKNPTPNQDAAVDAAASDAPIAAPAASPASEEEEDFGALLAKFEHMQPIIGEMCSGRVIAISRDYVTVDIGFKSEGQIPSHEFMRPGSPELAVKVGDEVDVILEDLEDDDGSILLSKEKADKQKVWDRLEKYMDADGVVEGIIMDRVKGGLAVNVEGIKAFLPGSQVDLRPVRNLDKLINQSYKFQIIKFNRKRGNLVLSRRALLERERAELRAKTVADLEEGATVEGTVKNITNYGAFIDLGGIDGLLHITDMSWGRINHPSEMLQISDEVKVKVLKYDAEHERVSLGLKQLSPDPWSAIGDKYPIGEKIAGKVVSLAEYGAFVELEDGVEGLIHVSEMSWTRRIKHPSKLLNVGDVVEVIVLDIDQENRRISLGLKQAQPNPWEVLSEKYPAGTIIQGKIRNITDFGLFVGIEEGIDGLVHVSDISWTEKIKHPGERFKKGQEIEAVVLSVDPTQERFSLGLKQLRQDPWQTLPARYYNGKIIKGTVTKITDFGVFVELEEDIEGLVHISELANERVEDPAKIVSVGQEVSAEVLSVDPDDRRISLSMKALMQSEDKMRMAEYLGSTTEESAPSTTLGDLIKAKLGKVAEEKAAKDAEGEDSEA